MSTWELCGSTLPCIHPERQAVRWDQLLAGMGMTVLILFCKVSFCSFRVEMLLQSNQDLLRAAVHPRSEETVMHTA